MKLVKQDNNEYNWTTHVSLQGSRTESVELTQAPEEQDHKEEVKNISRWIDS